MKWDLWLLTCGCLSCCYHSCRLGAGGYRAGAGSKGFVEIRTWNNSPQGSRRGADYGDASAGLSAQTQWHFGLAAPRRGPEERRYS